MLCKPYKFQDIPTKSKIPEQGKLIQIIKGRASIVESNSWEALEFKVNNLIKEGIKRQNLLYTI